MKLQDPALFRTRGWVNGEWVEGRGGSWSVTNPATGASLGEVTRFTAEDTRAAIVAAEQAQRGWRRETAATRARIVRRFADLMMQHQEDLAAILTAEEGKPLAESRGEIAYAASFLEWFSEEAPRAYGDVLPGHRADMRLLVQREPVGVSAAITPWNFPSAMITRKVGPALALGCAMVLKPAEDTPFSALALAELSQRAGVPPGLFNVVVGDREDSQTIGAELCQSPIVRKLSFTGSTAVGKHLLAQCAGTVKRVSLELGGNAPFIVFDDADIEAALSGAMGCKFRNAGQVCIAANRFLVQEGVYEEFAQALGARIASLKVAPGMEQGAQVGPLITEAGLAKVERHVEDALTRGARVAVGGERHGAGGTFYTPTLLLDATGDMVMSQEETFGPVAGLRRFSTEEEVLHIANDTRSGLAAYFYSRDNARVWRMSEGLEYGMVGVNTGQVSASVAPFGGMKESGLGREGSHFGCEEWLETKYVCIGGVS